MSTGNGVSPSDPGMHHGTCATHLPWCMWGSLTSGGGENFPGIPFACATRNFTYLAIEPCVNKYSDHRVQNENSTHKDILLDTHAFTCISSMMSLFLSPFEIFKFNNASQLSLKDPSLSKQHTFDRYTIVISFAHWHCAPILAFNYSFCLWNSYFRGAK